MYLCVHQCVFVHSKCWLMHLWLCQPFGRGGTGVTLPQNMAQTSHITAQWGHCATQTFLHRALGLLHAVVSCVCVSVCVAPGEGDLDEIFCIKEMCAYQLHVPTHSVKHLQGSDKYTGAYTCTCTHTQTHMRRHTPIKTQLEPTHRRIKTHLGDGMIFQCCKISILCESGRQVKQCFLRFFSNHAIDTFNWTQQGNVTKYLSWVLLFCASLNFHSNTFWSQIFYFYSPTFITVLN